MEIWLPESAKPRYRCRICKKSFSERESKRYERHVAQCAKDHEAELHDRSPRQQHPAFFTAWDPDLEQWVRRNKPQGGVWS